MTSSPHRLKLIPGKKQQNHGPQGKRPEKSPEEWTPEETLAAFKTVDRIHFLITQLMAAQQCGKKRPECATKLKEALDALFSGTHAAAILLMAAMPFASG
jgi:hypothetical protein